MKRGGGGRIAIICSHHLFFLRAALPFFSRLGRPNRSMIELVSFFICSATDSLRFSPLNCTDLSFDLLLTCSARSTPLPGRFTRLARFPFLILPYCILNSLTSRISRPDVLSTSLSRREIYEVVWRLLRRYPSSSFSFSLDIASMFAWNRWARACMIASLPFGEERTALLLLHLLRSIEVYFE